MRKKKATVKKATTKAQSRERPHFGFTVTNNTEAAMIIRKANTFFDGNVSKLIRASIAKFKG